MPLNKETEPKPKNRPPTTKWKDKNKSYDGRLKSSKAEKFMIINRFKTQKIKLGEEKEV